MYSIMQRCVFVLFFSLLFFAGKAQKKEPLLEREVTISASNESASSILTQIAAQTGIKFSYSPSLIPADKKVSFRVIKKPLRTVLLMMFADAVAVKEKGSFIILTAKPQAPPQAIVKEITIAGYVYDEHGEKLAYASIFNKKEQTAAVTNRYGLYSLKVSINQLPLDLKVVKENYNDTAFKVNAKQKQVDVVLSHEIKPAEPVAIKPDSVAVPQQDSVAPIVIPPHADTSVTANFSGLKKMVSRFALSNEDKANIRNLKDTLFSSVQFSIIPQLSTNKLLVGNTVNDVSLSLFLGYSKGINVAGFSGIMNYTSGDVKYAQAAGLINNTGGNIKGGQAAGWLNVVEGTVTGGQAAGLMNVVDGKVKGGQAAGLMNIVDSNVAGGQAAGLMNIINGDLYGGHAAGLGNIINGNCEGVQVAGLFNITGGHANGVQIAGVTNITNGGKGELQIAGVCNISDGEVRGVQLAGVANSAGKNVNGLQLAGLLNSTDSAVNGLQISGFINRAREVNGVQFGLLNFAQVNNGISFGLFSFTKNGYRKIELFGDDVMYTNLALRTGTQKFHNIFIAGVDMTSRVSGLWNFGYGFGSFFNLNDKWKLGGDITAQVYLKGGAISKAPQVNHLFIGVERMIGNKFSVSLGPTYHVMVNYSTGGDTEVADIITPYSFYNRTYTDGTNVKMWIGGKLSLKFF